MTPEALERFMNANVWTVGVDAELAVAPFTGGNSPDFVEIAESTLP
jgi:hypothetical protein